MMKFTVNHGLRPCAREPHDKQHRSHVVVGLLVYERGQQVKHLLNIAELASCVILIPIDIKCTMRRIYHILPESKLDVITEVLERLCNSVWARCIYKWLAPIEKADGELFGSVAPTCLLEIRRLLVRGPERTPSIYKSLFLRLLNLKR